MGEFLTRNGLFGPGAARPRGRKRSSENSKKIGGGSYRRFRHENIPPEKRVPCDRLGDKNNGAIEPIRGSRSGSEGPFRIRPK